MRHSKAMNAMPDMIYVAIAIFTFDLKSGKKELCGMQNFSSYTLKVLVLGQKKSGRGRDCICGGPYVLVYFVVSNLTTLQKHRLNIKTLLYFIILRNILICETKT